jgi:hypothetical protein
VRKPTSSSRLRKLFRFIPIESPSTREGETDAVKVCAYLAPVFLSLQPKKTSAARTSPGRTGSKRASGLYEHQPLSPPPEGGGTTGTEVIVTEAATVLLLRSGSLCFASAVADTSTTVPAAPTRSARITATTLMLGPATCRWCHCRVWPKPGCLQQGWYRTGLLPWRRRHPGSLP